MNPQTKTVIFAFCLVKLGLHLIADSNAGFQGDELLHIQTGNHLAFGFMEFPPLISVFAFVQNLFQSEAVFVHHLFSHIAAILILVVVAKTVLVLGGKTRAVFLVLICMMIAPGLWRSQHLFQPVVFSQLFWVLNFYFLTKYIKHLDRRYLWLLTLGAAAAFLTKYDAVFFIFGVAALLIFMPIRAALIQHQFWWHILIFLLFISPNIIWQLVNDFPVLKMFDRLYEMHLDQLSVMEVVSGLIVSLNPLSLLLIVPGIIYMFHPGMKSYRPATVAILLSALLLALSQGKGYYFYPIILTILPFGAVFWEKLVIEKREWLFYLIGLLLSIGVVLTPFGMPLFPLESYLANDYPLENREVVSGGEYNVAFEERYSKEKWELTLAALQNVVDSLSNAENESAFIWGKHYGQAGAVKLFQERYDLPDAFSLHGSFYNWAPDGAMPAITIALSYNVGQFFDPYFEEVIRVKTIYNPYSENEEELHQHIYVCKNPRQTFDELKMLFKDRIYE